MKNIFFNITVFFLFLSSLISAQTEQVQPTIMVVPWTSSSEDILEKLENDFTYRATLSKIKQAFDERGFTTYDFVTAIQNYETNQVQDWQTQKSIFTEIANNSPSDMFVKAEVKIQRTSLGDKVYVILETVDNYTNQSLANSTFESRAMRTTDYTRLVEYALNKEDEENKGNRIEAYLHLLNTKFADVRERGRSINIRIVVDGNSEIALDDEAGTDYDLISELIEDWLREKAYKNYVHIKVNTGTLLHCDEVKIPLKDEAGNNFDVNRFARNLRKHIADLGKQTTHGKRLKITRDIRGNELTLTLKTD